jgi:hypothetical protein
MRKSVVIDLFGVITRPFHLNTPGLGYMARSRIKRTRDYWELAKQLRDAGGPELKLSVFEVNEETFLAAMADAGVECCRDSRGFTITFFWEDFA